MQRYEKYKDSGVDWIGEIPEKWKIQRIKTLFKEINERSFDGSEDLLSVSQYTGVTKKSDKIGEGDLLTNASTLEGYKIVRKSDLVSNIMLTWNGSLGFSPYNGITSPAYSVYRLKSKGEETFFHYLFRTEKYKAEFKRQSSGVIESRLRLYTDDFFSIHAILPPLSEQQAIASFLDDKTSKIDQTISIKEKEIELLKERRQILIQKAVTKGLDDHVKMKDSGVEWIGEIPEHWEVRKLKYTLKIRNEKVECKSTNKTYVGMENIESQTGKYLSTNTEVEGLANAFYKDDILFGKLRPYLAKVYLSKFDGICSTEFLVFSSPNSPYYQRLMLSDIFIKLVDSSTYGAKMPRASSAFINNIAIPETSLKEQTQIVSYLEKVEEKIAKAISLKEQEVEKLKEYKTVLIDNAVTGKIKVN